MITIQDQVIHAGKQLEKISARLLDMQEQNFAQRFWKKDPALWNNAGELPMGWLDAVDNMLNVLPDLEQFSREVMEKGFRSAVLLGMGGSSLAPLVLVKSVPTEREGLKLTVLDTTDPETIREAEQRINMEETLFIVSSKSGTTAEIKALTEHFFQRLSALRKEQAGDHFIAITDKGSPLEKLAKQRKFLRTFINFEEIGGRYSALSYFGMVPAALAGLPVKEILLRAKEMEKACGQDVPVKDNPAFVLGAALGEFAFQKCNKLTYLVPPGFSEFGLWLEQLVAESSGKEGKGILPVNGHPFSATGTFGKDRIFFRLSKQEEMQPFEQAEEPLATHHPMVNIHLKDPLDIGKEFLRWEIATATLGSVLGVNPFDQPNVEESKRHTIELLKKSGDDETFQGPGSVISEGPLYFYTAEPQDHAVALVLNFFVKQRPGDYLALLAYLPEKPEVDQCLIEMQQFLQNRSRITVTTQYGPRYLHSTGQLHKGGPAEGIFVQFTSSTDADIQVPECNYTFGSLKRAQAFGDRQALMSKGKKVLLVDLGKDTLKGLQAFRELLAHVPVSAKRHRKPIYSTDKNVKTRRTSMT